MKTIIKILCVLTLVFGLSSCGYERIDAGAYQRYKILSNNWGHIVFNKVRDLETGKIKEFSIGREVNCYCPTFTFIDDLCDAGGTFLGELKVLKEISRL